MNIVALDPGATTGYVVYDTKARRVVARGEFHGHDTVCLWSAIPLHVVAVERLVPHGASYPQVVEAAYIAGRIVGQIQLVVHEMKRTEVRGILQEATHGAVKVKDDKSVWAALLELHGGESAGERGGLLHGVRSHERAALAVAVAFVLRQQPATQASGGAAT